MAPGWSFLGQELAQAVPADRDVVSTGTLAYPQLRHYLWRHVWHDRKEPRQFTIDGKPVVLLRDVNTSLPAATEAFLGERTASTALVFDVFDLSPGAPAPRLGHLASSAPEWTLSEERFGDALSLDLYGISPEEIIVRNPDLARRFLGVPWTPEQVTPRLVRASFSWTRLDGPAGTLVPEYQLLHHDEDGVHRAPIAWPIEPADQDLARLPPGTGARRHVHFFFGEWLPPGDYELIVSVTDRGRLVPVTTPGRDPREAPQISLGRVVYRFGATPSTP